MSTNKSKTILVVDDSPLMRTMLKDLLAARGYHVSCAEQAQDGCQLIETHPFDLIITDLKMPGMDGVAFIRKVRQTPNGRFVPIVVMTGESDQRRIAEAKQLGVSTFLEKPFRGSKLAAVLQILFGP